MILKHIYDERLAHGSYLVGCAATGEAIVIDPNRDVQQYVELAKKEGLRITAVTETHIHADYASGARELASVTNAHLYLSDEGDEDWKYAFSGESNVKLVRDGDKIHVGNLTIGVIKTPGHTPEHISFSLVDNPASSKVLGVFTGDFVFVGDVGRPDLLEKAAGIENTMKQGAAQLWNSLQSFVQNTADDTIIWPAHGAGSACGKALGGVPYSTLGYEKTSNWALKLNSEEDFITEVLAGQPDPPPYFAVMKKINKQEMPFVTSLGQITQLEDSELDKCLSEGTQVLDIRPNDEVTRAFVPGCISIPLNGSFLRWAGWLVNYKEPIAIVAPDALTAQLARNELLKIGLDNVRGWISQSAVLSHASLESIMQSDPNLLNDYYVIDARNPDEFQAGQIPGAINLPAGKTHEWAPKIPTDRPVAIHCQGGGRSSMCYTVLRAKGLTNITNVTGGYSAYKR